MTLSRVTIPIRAAASVLIACCLSAGAAENVRITTNDSRVITGELLSARTAATLIVRTGVRDVYLSSHIVKSIDQAAAQTVPTYTLKANLKRVDSTPKKGKIAMVVTETRLTGFAQNGSGSVSLRDPKLGRVSFAVVVTRLTPQTYEFQGVEYDWKLGFPCAFPSWRWKSLIFKEIDFKNAKSLTKAVNFFAQAGDNRTAQELLAALEKLDPAAAAKQRAAAEIDAVRKTLRQAENLELRDMRRRAAALVASAKMGDKARSLNGDLAARLDAESARLKRSLDTLPGAAKILTEHGITARRLSIDEARRLVKAVSLGVDGGKLTKQHLHIYQQHAKNGIYFWEIFLMIHQIILKV